MVGRHTDKTIIRSAIAHWAGFVALVSFVMSIYTLYVTSLRPFAPHAVAAGRIVLLKNPFSSELKQDAFMIDVIFTNRGANRGVVEDVAVSFNAGSGDHGPLGGVGQVVEKRCASHPAS